jgi:hypothetical protein
LLLLLLPQGTLAPLIMCCSSRLQLHYLHRGPESSASFAAAAAQRLVKVAFVAPPESEVRLRFSSPSDARKYRRSTVTPALKE